MKRQKSNFYDDAKMAEYTAMAKVIRLAQERQEEIVKEVMAKKVAEIPLIP